MDERCIDQLETSGDRNRVGILASYSRNLVVIGALLNLPKGFDKFAPKGFLKNR